MDSVYLFIAIWLLCYLAAVFWQFRAFRALSSADFSQDATNIGNIRNRPLLSIVALSVLALVLSSYAILLAGERQEQVHVNEHNKELHQSELELAYQTIEDLNHKLQEKETVNPLFQNNTGNTAPIEDLYSAVPANPDHQSAIDALKSRYEEMLVTYFFLRKCGKVESQDYFVVMVSLGQEMASINAPGRLQYDILLSARGSYKEMYSKSSCQGLQVETLHQQFTEYTKSLSESAMAQP